MRGWCGGGEGHRRRAGERWCVVGCMKRVRDSQGFAVDSPGFRAGPTSVRLGSVGESSPLSMVAGDGPNHWWVQ